MNHGTMGEPQQPWNKDANFRTPEAQVCISTTSSPVPYESIHQPMTLKWHSVFSPYQYTLCELPPAVKKVLRRWRRIRQNYRMPLNNIIVKHVDRRLRGSDEIGQLVYSPVFGGSVHVDRTFYERLTCGQQLAISSFDFGLNTV